MRTQGTFIDVYRAAQNHFNEDLDDRPLNPVIRRENGVWMLESDMEPQGEGINFEVTLSDFDDYWYETYDSVYTPSDTEIQDFIEFYSEV